MSLRPALAVAVVGGDARQAEVARLFREAGADVRAAGVPGAEALPGVTLCTSLGAALDGAAIAVGPVQGVDAAGAIVSQRRDVARLVPAAADLAGMQPGGRFFIGQADDALRALCGRFGIALHEYRERDEFAILNSIPSAEGAIQMAMDLLPVTLHGSEAVVIGYGRTGSTLCRMLAGLGARVTALARRPEQRARARADGVRAAALETAGGGGPEAGGGGWTAGGGGWAGPPSLSPEERGAESALAAADVVFNTAPAPVLNRERLALLRPGTPIIDLASAPGGVDRAAAAEMGLVVRLAPGLPGKVAPRSAGRYVFEVVASLLAAAPPRVAEPARVAGGDTA